MAVWYVEDDNTSHAYGWSALTARANSTAYSVGQIRKQDGTVSQGNERAYICLAAGTSGASSPTWAYTKGVSVTDGDVAWREITGQPAVNGDATNTPAWTASTNYATTSPIVKNTAGTHYFAVGVDAGSSGASEPTWNTTTGTTTVDSGLTWVCIGAVGDFAAWGAPFARFYVPLGTGFMAAGDTAYVSDRHIESSASSFSVTSSNGTNASPLKVICASHTSAPPTSTATTASITTSGVTLQLYAYFYGLSIAMGGLSTMTVGGGSDGAIALEECAINLSGAVTGSLRLSAGHTGDDMNIVELINCTINGGGDSCYTALYAGSILFDRCTLTGTWTSSGSFSLYEAANVKMRDCDLSPVTGTLIDMSYPGLNDVVLANCKLGSGVTISDNAWGTTKPGHSIRAYNCDSANTNTRYYLNSYRGDVFSETTTVRTGGASDGTTSVSWKAVSSANASLYKPLSLDPIAIWNSTTGSSLTATVEIAGAASLNNDDIWMEIEYLGSSTACTGFVVSNRRGLLASAAAVTSSTASWGGSPTYTQKLQATFTPQKAGPVVARVYVGKASATVYVDPMITIT